MSLFSFPAKSLCFGFEVETHQAAAVAKDCHCCNTTLLVHYKAGLSARQAKHSCPCQGTADIQNTSSNFMLTRASLKAPLAASMSSYCSQECSCSLCFPKAGVCPCFVDLSIRDASHRAGGAYLQEKLTCGHLLRPHNI